MSQRIQHKKTSIPGTRPSNLYLEPGELALNSSASDPGLFFELSDGTVAKAGPTHIGPIPPKSEVGYGIGETWFNNSNQTNNIWVPALERWVPTLSPFCGGSETIVFVGSEFPQATDDLENDGYSRPFSTLNRAVLEIAKRVLISEEEDPKYIIYLLPGRNVCINDPGEIFSEFEKKYSTLNSVSPDFLRSFNPETGGLLIPRGTSIVGMDLRKSKITPSYYPFWSRRLYETEPELISPRTSIVKWTGNSFFNSFSFTDKNPNSLVTRIEGQPEDIAVLYTERPHGFRPEGEFVEVSYSQGVPRLFRRNATIPEGTYKVEPLNSHSLYLKNISDNTYITRKELPDTTSNKILQIKISLTSHHRLSAIEFAKLGELNQFYEKVQKTFSTTAFVNKTANTEATSGETEIVSQATDLPSSALSGISNSSPYVYNVSVKSNYGLCGLNVDGNSVTGFRSALACNFTVVSLQNDPDAFEVYSNEKWTGLRDLYLSVNGNFPDDDSNIIKYMVDSVSLENIRYYHRDNLDIIADDKKSSGLTDEKSDTRHYSVLSSNGSFVHCVASMAIGLAINYWTKSGGLINLTNANSTFGGVALRSEGFKGIGTLGGSESLDSGFIVQGIRRPKSITRKDVVANTKKTFLNSHIVAAGLDFIDFSSEIDLSVLYPYTLKPGGIIWVEDFSNGVAYKATIRNQQPILSPDKKRLYVVQGTNQIFSGGGLISQNLDLPYVRRFVDPRKPEDQYYSLWIRNTSPTHRPPQVGSVLRFAEKPGENVSNLLKLGVQLDPGNNGGWGHVFVVTSVQSKKEGDNPNFSKKLFNQNIGQDYYVSITPVDLFTPWVASGNNGFSTSQYVFPEGSLCTSRDRIYYGTFNDFPNISPEIQDSVWSYSMTYEYCQPTTRTWFSQSNEQASDLLSGQYADTTVSYTYPRGIGYKNKEVYNVDLANFDNGLEDLGLINPELYDPWWLPTKVGLTRFLYLLGFTYSQMSSFLIPQVWTNRNLDVNLLPAVTGKGYALSTGTWPIEFNQPSTILCGNHSWEWCGYLNYGKGLPKYQKGELTLRQRIDFLATEIWGGKIHVTGFTEQGEFVNSGNELLI